MNILLPLFLVTEPAAAQAKAMQMEEQKMMQASASTSSSKSVIMITPKERADDLQKAFEFMKKEKSTSKVYVTFSGGQKISNVIDMTMMPGKTIFIFRYSTPEGIKFKVAPIEDITSIEHS